MSSPAGFNPGQWRSLSRSANPEEPPKGLDSLWHKANGLIKRRTLGTRAFLSRARRILGLEKRYVNLSEEKLRIEAERLRQIICRGREKAEDIDLACALIREGAYRVFGFRHHAVQVAGALAMYRGCIAEMATGEGKTLTATIPAILAGWRGRGCHVVTVNDYLAARDCEEMSKLYRFFHLRAASIIQEAKPPERLAAYQADITYLTNKEVAADYLRDRIALGANKTLSGFLLSDILAAGPGAASGVVQRGLEFAVVDEADSVLIDEAVTPLIISADGGSEERKQSFMTGRDLAGKLDEKRDYRIDWKYKELVLTPAGKRRLKELAEPLGGIWKGARRREEIVHQSLTANHFFRKGAEYIIDEGKVVIVDEATGRLMPERSWRDGLHQAVEAKEEVEITPPKETLARISFQRFFRLYGRLSGMTGTGNEARGEFWHIYRLPVVPIPTNRPCRRIMNTPKVYRGQERKWKGVVEEIKRVHALDRPILVGTRSIKASETLSEMLAAAGLEHQVLNAVFHRKEAEIVARAGKEGRITVATNMAGRGTDIKLTREAEKTGGLHVIATERHMSYRVDRQLYGRSARQGDPGSASTFVSLDDELPRRFSPWLARLLWRLGPAVYMVPFLRMWIFNRSAAKAESMAFKQRQGVLQSDTWLKDHLGFAGEDL